MSAIRFMVGGRPFVELGEARKFATLIWQTTGIAVRVEEIYRAPRH